MVFSTRRLVSLHSPVTSILHLRVFNSSISLWSGVALLWLALLALSSLIVWRAPPQPTPDAKTGVEELAECRAQKSSLEEQLRLREAELADKVQLNSQCSARRMHASLYGHASARRMRRGTTSYR
eukprot:6213337-Pleurochrysis_carterae.AAC.1